LFVLLLALQLAAAHGLYSRFLKPDAEQDIGLSEPLRDRITAIINANPIDKFEKKSAAASLAAAAAAAVAAAAPKPRATMSLQPSELVLTPNTFDQYQRHALNQMRGTCALLPLTPFLLCYQLICLCLRFFFFCSGYFAQIPSDAYPQEDPCACRHAAASEPDADFWPAPLNLKNRMFLL
jgi:hypothetical protein